MNILFASSEAFPLIKTGGLADVSGSLPRSLQNHGHDVRLVLPAYQPVMASVQQKKRLLTQRAYGHTVSIWQTVLPGSRVQVWLVDCAEFFERPGNPYVQENGEPWPDNAYRFALFGRMVALLGLNALGLDWQADVVHCNDWQTGLAPVELSYHYQRPASVFSIHNMAYQGNFDKRSFQALQLPPDLWHYDKLEFYNQVSFMKGGLIFADMLNAVSPSYAREIQTEAFGYGMEGLLARRKKDLCGILNGIDTKYWNPGTDPLIAKKYNRKTLHQKAINKQALQKHFGLAQEPKIPLLALISRLTSQKGIDMVIDTLQHMKDRPLQFVLLGSGDQQLQHQLLELQHAQPDRVSIRTGYDEALSHQIEAGADIFLMPSRYEPCGLNQMYSQRYGTLPIVTPVGGLHDTVTDYGNGMEAANGFVMDEVSSASLEKSLRLALDVYPQKTLWQQMQENAMSIDYSWENSAAGYLDLYLRAIETRDRRAENKTSISVAISRYENN